MKKYLYILILSLSSCFPFTYQEEQVPFLLPETVEIKEKEVVEEGISTLTTYSIQGNYSLSQLVDFPIYAMSNRGWKVIAWHSVSEREIENILFFLDTNFDYLPKKARKRIELLLSNEVFIAYFYDRDKLSFNTKREDYDVYVWMDLCILDYEQNELFYLSYGKF